MTSTTQSEQGGDQSAEQLLKPKRVLKNIQALSQEQRLFIKKLEKGLPSEGEFYGISTSEGALETTVHLYADRVAFYPGRVPAQVRSVKRDYLTFSVYGDTYFVYIDGNAGQRAFDDILEKREKQIDRRLKKEKDDYKELQCSVCNKRYNNKVEASKCEKEHEEEVIE